MGVADFYNVPRADSQAAVRRPMPASLAVSTCSKPDVNSIEALADECRDDHSILSRDPVIVKAGNVQMDSGAMDHVALNMGLTYPVPEDSQCEPAP